MTPVLVFRQRIEGVNHGQVQVSLLKLSSWSKNQMENVMLHDRNTKLSPHPSAVSHTPAICAACRFSGAKKNPHLISRSYLFLTDKTCWTEFFPQDSWQPTLQLDLSYSTQTIYNYCRTISVHRHRSLILFYASKTDDAENHTQKYENVKGNMF